MAQKRFSKVNNFLALSIVASIFISALIGLIGIAGAALQAVGPVAPAGGPGAGFPTHYQDTNGLAVDLMEAADAFSISDPVDPNNPFSQQIGFNAEAFWWSTDGIITPHPSVPGGRILMVLAMEAAFAGEAAVDGEQSAFGRVRFTIDVPEAGTYIVRYPYGQKTYIVDAVGPGPEIRDSSDIGCFAIAGVISCDPNSPPGNPYNFGLALQSGVGPFLTWDTFNLDPILTDPQLVNPGNPGKRYIGNPNVEHRIKGSPVGQNFFRVEGPNIGGPGINFVETNLFTVSGRIIAINQPPVITTILQQDAAAGSSFSFQVIATDPDNDPLVYSLIGAPAGMTISAAGLINYNPAIQGNYNFNVQVSDNINPPVSSPITLIVSSSTPTLSSINVAAVLNIGATQQFKAIALDQSGNVLASQPSFTWSSSNNAIGTINSAGLFSALSAGQTIVSAASGAISQNFLVIVNPPAPTPITINPIPQQAGTVGVFYNYQVIATGGQGALTYSLTGTVPAWISINSATGLISGTPTTQGNYNFNVRVTDGVSTVTSPISMTISPAGFSVSSTTPANNEANVAYSGLVLTATFNRNVYAPSVNSKTFLLKDNLNNPAYGYAYFDGTRAKLLVYGSLKKNTAYTATLTTGIKDSAGNPLSSNYAWRFTTRA